MVLISAGGFRGGRRRRGEGSSRCGGRMFATCEKAPGRPEAPAPQPERPGVRVPDLCPMVWHSAPTRNVRQCARATSAYLGIDGDMALGQRHLVSCVERGAGAVRIDGCLLADAHRLGQERIDGCCSGGDEDDMDTSGRAHAGRAQLLFHDFRSHRDGLHQGMSLLQSRLNRPSYQNPNTAPFAPPQSRRRRAPPRFAARPAFDLRARARDVGRPDARAATRAPPQSPASVPSSETAENYTEIYALRKTADQLGTQL